MNFDLFITQMTNNAATVRNLTQGIAEEQSRWKPNPESWSILEVVNHLYDEEHADFRMRLDYILHHPGQPWPPINPQGWVTERQYQQRTLEESVNRFLYEREKSLAWLKELANPHWQTEAKTPFGTMMAGDMFASWLAHDLLHLRQLLELHWAYTIQSVQPYRVDYAGEW